MQLHTLYALGLNCEITDEGIKHMQLHTLDTSGNDAHGSPVGNIVSVLPTSQISCRAVSIPENTSSSVYDAIDTEIDIDDDVGDEVCGDDPIGDFGRVLE